MKIVIHDSIETKAYNEVVTSLVSYNLRFTKSFDSIESPLEILVYNSDDVIIAGAYGRSHWGTMEIQTFVVDENYRNNGIGKQLMNAVISEAVNRKCAYISLDTLSFQAPEFYKKFDFNIIGEEYNEYYNFSKIYLRKTL